MARFFIVGLLILYKNFRRVKTKSPELNDFSFSTGLIKEQLEKGFRRLRLKRFLLRRCEP